MIFKNKKTSFDFLQNTDLSWFASCAKNHEQIVNKLVTNPRDRKNNEHQLVFDQEVAEKEISDLERAIGLTLPEELIRFYSQVGTIKTKSADGFNALAIYSPADLLKKVNDGLLGRKLGSLGVIDRLFFDEAVYPDQEWIQPERCFSVQEIQHLNSNFHCFGSVSLATSDVQYLYFDKQGKFGSFYHYHDDDTVIDEFRDMLRNKARAASMASMMTSCINKNADMLIEYYEELD